MAQKRDHELGRKIVGASKTTIAFGQTPEALANLRGFLDTRPATGAPGHPEKSPRERLVDQVLSNLIDRFDEIFRYWNKHLPRHKKTVVEIETYLERKNFPALAPGARLEIQTEMAIKLGGQRMALTLKPTAWPWLRHAFAVQLSDYRTLRRDTALPTERGYRGRGGSIKLRAAMICVAFVPKLCGETADVGVRARWLLGQLKKRPLTA